MAEATTKDIILDTAEKLYADKGFTGTSLRAIMKTAGVNMASVHYHFGSKEALIEAVIRRRTGPIIAARLAGLDRLEAASSAPLPAEKIVEAFLRPVAELFASDPADTFLPRLLGRVVMEAGHELRDIITTTFGEMDRRFGAALKRALPDLDENAVYWRMHFMIGAMAFSIAVPHPHCTEDHMQFDIVSDPNEFLDDLVQFVTHGMLAPRPEPARGDAS
jgi:AcrR family transcriptional regulator